MPPKPLVLPPARLALGALLLGAALLPPARAQAPAPGAPGVSLFGVIDLSVERVGPVAAPGSSGATRMPGLTGSVPSRFGIRGSEDLGGGLRAEFVLEQGLAADVGGVNQAGRVFGRQALVGLTGPWGTVALGRQYTMLFWSQLQSDLLGPNAYGSGSLDAYLPNARSDNTVSWRGQAGPWRAGATYSLGRDVMNAGPGPAGTNCPGEDPADARACRAWSLMLGHDTANWGVTGAIDQLRGGPGAFGGLTRSVLADRRSTLTGWWRSPSGMRLGAGLIHRHNQGSATLPRSDLWYLTAAWPVTPLWRLEGGLFRLDYRGSPQGATLAALRLTRSLSTRTALYANLGQVWNDGTLALGVSGAAPGSGPAPGRGQHGLMAGLRHSF